MTESGTERLSNLPRVTQLEFVPGSDWLRSSCPVYQPGGTKCPGSWLVLGPSKKVSWRGWLWPKHILNYFQFFCCCCLDAQLCLTLCDPVDCSMPGFPVFDHLPELAQPHVHWASDAMQPSHGLLPFLLLPSIFPSIRVFSNESALCIGWPKYWSFSFSISPSSERSGLTSFKID